MLEFPQAFEGENVWRCSFTAANAMSLKAAMLRIPKADNSKKVARVGNGVPACFVLPEPLRANLNAG
jgi:hypothetical protein